MSEKLSKTKARYQASELFFFTFALNRLLWLIFEDLFKDINIAVVSVLYKLESSFGMDMIYMYVASIINNKSSQKDR